MGFHSPEPRTGRRGRSVQFGFVALALVSLLVPAAATASYPGQNGLLVFSGLSRTDKSTDVRHTHLWLTSTHGNAVQQLTSAPMDDLTPRWSPDGRTIAFVRYQQAANGTSLGAWIYMLDVASGAESLLTDAGSFAWPSWSPDGLNIVFSGRLAADLNMPGGNIFVMQAAGGELHQLTFGTAANSGPAWSPRGDLIAFSSNAGLGGSAIWLMNPDGTAQHAIESDLSYAQSPSWSPDGEWLVVSGMFEGPTPQLFKMRPDGSDLTQITDVADQDKLDPVWSPDGGTILFQMWPGHGTHGSGELYTVPASGGMVQSVGTRHLESQATADWQPLRP
jgi:TolB protein